METQPIINNEKHDVAYYLKQFHEIQFKNFKENKKNINGKLIFRGQAVESWNVMSSAGRRLLKTNNNSQKDFITYHVNLITNARKYGYGELQAGSTLSDIEILAQIQHYGGATCLVDFSTNFLIALWMATEKKNSKCECEHYSIENKQKDSNGKVIWLNMGDEINQSNILYYNNHKEGDSIQHLLTKVQWNFERKDSKVEPCFWYWEPNKLNNRIVKQDSIFLFGLSAFPNVRNSIDKQSRLDFDELIILSEDKQGLRDELENIFGISAESVYFDLSGYALNANNFSIPINDKILPRFNCLYNAKENLKKEQFSLAINYLDEAISCKCQGESESITDNSEKCRKGKGEICTNNDVGELLFWKAVAHKSKNELNEALLNFQSAEIRLKNSKFLSSAVIHRLLCACYRRMSVIYYSKHDYNSAINIERKLVELYLQNRLNTDSTDQDTMNGADALFALWELSIITFDNTIYPIDEKTKTDYSKEIEQIVNSNNNNSKILYTFLKNLSILIFSSPNDKSPNIDISNILNKIDENAEVIFKNGENALLSYFYWDYHDVIDWIERTSLNDTEIKIEENNRVYKEFIKKNAGPLLLIAEKAQDAQTKILNKIFSKAHSVVVEK